MPAARADCIPNSASSYAVHLAVGLDTHEHTSALNNGQHKPNARSFPPTSLVGDARSATTLHYTQTTFALSLTRVCVCVAQTCARVLFIPPPPLGTHLVGSTPSRSAASKYRSGAGFPFSTSSHVTTASNRSRMPCPRRCPERRVRRAQPTSRAPPACTPTRFICRAYMSTRARERK